jgi:chlorite dismutase
VITTIDAEAGNAIRLKDRAFTFVGGEAGGWRVLSQTAIVGAPLLPVAAVDVVSGLTTPSQPGAAWTLRGVTSHQRYVNRDEHERLAAVQPPLRRESATMAAMIPLSKSAAWWLLSQDERRAIVEEQSEHIRIGMRYLPAVARRLHHGRDLGEPFDFVTWFEFAPADAPAFDELVAALRASPEWRYVEREVDFRLARV